MPFSEPRRIGDALGLSSSKPKLVDPDGAEDSLLYYVDDKEQETSELNLHNYDQMYQAWSDYLYKQLPKRMRSIAISHAFVMGGEVGGSERTLSVGGSEQVSPHVFKTSLYSPWPFTWTATDGGRPYSL